MGPEGITAAVGAFGVGQAKPHSEWEVARGPGNHHSTCVPGLTSEEMLLPSSGRCRR